MKTLTLLTGCLLATLLSEPLAAQVCPKGITDPLQLLAGQTWVFQTASGDFINSGSSTVGRFTAQIQAPTTANPYTNGVLSITETVVNTTSVNRSASLSGRYSVNADCSGGNLMFALGGYGVQYEFVFTGGFSEIYMVSNSVSPTNPTSTEYGTAKLSTAATCPVGLANPLNYIGATTWSFHAQSPFWFTAGPVGTSDVGIITPTVGTDRNGNPTGVLTINETISTANGNVARQTNVPGRYLVDADCSGGELFFDMSGQAVQFRFLFISPTEMYMLTDSWNNGQIMAGHAKSY